MKTCSKRLAALLFAAVLIFSTMVLSVSAASVRASDYFWRTSVSAFVKGGGKIAVETTIVTVDLMDEVGVSKMVFYEEDSSGNFNPVKTYTRYNTPGMISRNNDIATVNLSYDGTPGVRYYATIYAYAKNSNGNETLCYDSRIVTA